MVYMFLANGFEETEALATLDIIRRAELDVKTVGIGGKTIVSKHEIPVVADIEDCDVNTSDMSAVILPGGVPGTPNLENSNIVKSAIKHCAQNNLCIAAICAAPSILGHMGLLKGKKATCFPGFEDELTEATILNEPVVKDENFITCKSMGHSIAFGLEIVKHLKDEQTAESIWKSII